VLIKDTSVETLAFSDYYPFGMPMPNRVSGANGYRYAFQGQEKDPETGKEAFEARLWDGRIGRWLTYDPAGAGFSPYVGMSNNPINTIDPDGRCPCDVCPENCGDYAGDPNQWYEDGILDEVVIVAPRYTENISEFDYGAKNGHAYAHVLKGNIEYDSKYLGASTNFSFLSADAKFNLNGRFALDATAEASFFKEDVSLRLGTDDFNVNGKGEFEFLSANAELSGGVLTGNDGRYGLAAKAEAGAYTVKADVTGGFTLFGVEVDWTVGVSGLSAHAGVHGGIYYDETTGKLVIKEVAHLGLGVGAKEGINIAIPVRWLWD
ncbi:RHS repeat-associated core domain-containing protein, partial [Psychroserpens luteolus]|uniref:RHS repeat-associated core domain-containing protein n=1 Tax=Psychroserpens luteolus TaxID=2855840 RepID=UPI001E393DAC